MFLGANFKWLTYCPIEALLLVYFAPLSIPSILKPAFALMTFWLWVILNSSAKDFKLTKS